jgi:hypothetical protein
MERAEEHMSYGDRYTSSDLRLEWDSSWSRYLKDTPKPKVVVALKHQCDSWSIGGVGEINQLMDDLIKIKQQLIAGEEPV